MLPYDALYIKVDLFPYVFAVEVSAFERRVQLHRIQGHVVDRREIPVHNVGNGLIASHCADRLRSCSIGLLAISRGLYLDRRRRVNDWGTVCVECTSISF